MLSYEAQVQPTAKPGWNVVLTAEKKMEREKIFLPNFMPGREQDLKGGTGFCVCWLLPLVCAHLSFKLTFPYRRRASPWGQHSGHGSAIALHSSATGEVQALGCNYEKTGANSGGAWTARLINSLPVRPSTLCFACRAIWHSSWVNLRDEIAIKCLNCTISSTI